MAALRRKRVTWFTTSVTWLTKGDEPKLLIVPTVYRRILNEVRLRYCGNNMLD
jgi:hypothetical protein